MHHGSLSWWILADKQVVNLSVKTASVTQLLSRIQIFSILNFNVYGSHCELFAFTEIAKFSLGSSNGKRGNYSASFVTYFFQKKHQS